MSRNRIVAVMSLSLLSFAMLGAGTEPATEENRDPKDVRIGELEKQLTECRNEVIRLQSHLNAFKETRTGTDLLRVLMAEPQIWEGTVTKRYDNQDGVRIECQFEAPDFKSQLTFSLAENPGDLTVGDSVRVSGRAEDLTQRRRREWFVVNIIGATLVEKSRPTPDSKTAG